MDNKSRRNNSLIQETLFWFLDRTQEIVTGCTASAIIYTRSPGVIYFTIGAVGTSIVAKILKRIFRKPRPANTTHKVTYGMPSTHSAVISYYATYITLSSLLLPPQEPFLSIPTFLPSALVLPWATSIACSRIWLGYHTVAQVIAGVSIGMLSAFVWYKFWVSGADVIITSVVNRVISLIPFLS